MKQVLIKILFLGSIIIVGCSNEVADYSDADNNVSTEVSQSSVAQSENIDLEEQESAEEKIEENHFYNIQNKVIYEDNNIRITAKSINYEELFGPEVKVLIENDSDKDIIVQANYCTVNDIMMSTMFSSDVASGKKSNDSIGFMSSDFTSYGIDIIRDIELELNILDAESFSSLYTSDIINLKTDAPDTYEQVIYDNGALAFSTKDVKVVVKKIDTESSFLGSELLVYIENNSNKNIMIQTRDVSINGFMVNPIFSCDVVAGKKAYDTITFLDSELEENEIEIIKNIELYFTAMDDKWNNYIETDIIQINFDE